MPTGCFAARSKAVTGIRREFLKPNARSHLENGRTIHGRERIRAVRSWLLSRAPIATPDSIREARCGCPPKTPMLAEGNRLPYRTRHKGVVRRRGLLCPGNAAEMRSRVLRAGRWGSAVRRFLP